jgi:hypothetical protein
MTELPTCALFASRAAARERETKLFLRADAPEGWLEGLIVSPVDGSRPTL